MTKGVLVVDDHAVVRDGIASIIETQDGLHVLGQASLGEQACELYASLSPDIVVLDLRLPDLDGTAVIERILSDDANAKILVLTTFGGDEDIYRALRAGAMGYLLKEAPRDELIAAIRAVSDGQQWVPTDLAQRVANRLSDTRLTPREQEVMGHIAEGRSNREIASEMGVSEGTVKTHVNSLLHKLGASSRTDALVKAVRRGLLRL